MGQISFALEVTSFKSQCNKTFSLYILQEWKIHHSKIHTKLHPGTKWSIFHIHTCEDIDDVISRSFTVVYANSQLKKMASDRFGYIIKKKITRWLEDMNFI